MERDNVDLEQSHIDDQWPLDHHIEEVLGALTEAARRCEIEPDALDEPFE